jgi:cobalt/nickel transport protein
LSYGLETLVESTMKHPLDLVLIALTLFAGTAHAHYHMLLPDAALVKKGQTVSFTFQFGHPYEHQLFNVTKPPRIRRLAREGDEPILVEGLKQVELGGADGKKVNGYQFPFTPEERGDYVFVAQAEPVWMEEDKEFLDDTVKVVLHVQVQKGWDAEIHEGVQMQPLTRPYGLQPGMVFQTQVNLAKGWAKIPANDIFVEVERYNAKPPEQLPADEHITRVVKTDRNGVATASLMEAGWWALTASIKGGTREKDGKEYPVRRRSTLWVYVDPAGSK